MIVGDDGIMWLRRMKELRERVFAAAASTIAPGSIKESLLRGHDVGLFALPNLQGGLLDGTGK